MKFNTKLFIFLLVSIGLGLYLWLILAWYWLNIMLLLIFLFLGYWGWDWFQHQVNKETDIHRLKKHIMDAYRLIKVLVLQGQTPYQAIQTILPFLESSLAEAFHDLMIEIDQDKSIHPYLEFAKQFQSLMVEQLLFSLYQLENQGGDGKQLQQFQYLFDQVEHQFYQQELLVFHEKMQQQNNWVMVATALIAMTLLLGVMQLIGGFLYGI